MSARTHLRLQHLLCHAGRAHQAVRCIQGLPGCLGVGLQVVYHLRRYCRVHPRRYAYRHLRISNRWY